MNADFSLAEGWGVTYQGHHRISDVAYGNTEEVGTAKQFGEGFAEGILRAQQQEWGWAAPWGA